MNNKIVSDSRRHELFQWVDGVLADDSKRFCDLSEQRRVDIYEGMMKCINLMTEVLEPDEVHESIMEAYSPEADITFLVKVRIGDHTNGEEVVGFYHGEPDPKETEYFKDKGVKWEETF